MEQLTQDYAHFLHYDEDMSYEEIGKQYNKHPEAVRALIRRARGKVSKKVERGDNRVLVIGDTQRRMVAAKDGSVVYSMPYTDKRGVVRGLRKLKQSISSNGYFRVAAPKGQERMVHRIVAQTYLKDWDDKLEVDHINGNKLDNRAENLRMVSKSQQAKGFQTHRGGSSKYRGVSWNKTKKQFSVYANSDGKRYRIYGIKDEKKAALEWDKLARSLGFPEEGLNSYNFPNLK